MYKKVNPDLNFVEREHNTLKFWKDNQIFEKSVKEREGCPTYMFYDGPPTANGPVSSSGTKSDVMAVIFFLQTDSYSSRG